MGIRDDWPLGPTDQVAVSRRGRLRNRFVRVCAGTVVVAGSIAFGAAPPALASGDSVGALSLSLSSLAPSAKNVTYSATFVATDGMTAGFSSIKLVGPTGTVFPGSGVTCSVDFVIDYTNGTESNCGTITVTNSGATLAFVENNIDINAGDEVAIIADGVTNAATSGTAKLSTSSDPTSVSVSVTLSSSGSIGVPNYKQSSYTASATGVTDTASFIATDGLTPSFSSVTLAAPAGTVFPGSGDTCSVDYVYDYTSGTVSNCGTITVTNSGATLTFVENNITIRPGDQVTVVATGVTNAAASGTLNISTSSDPTSKSVTTSGPSASPASLQLGSYTPSATEVTYQVNFTTTHGISGGSSQITLAAPSGTVFASSPNCYFVYDDTSGTSECAGVTGTGTDTVVLSSPTAAAGDEMTAFAPGVTNDSVGSSQNLTVSDVSDGTVATLAYTLSSAGAVTNTSLELNTLTPSATLGTYVASFQSTDALNSDGSTITLAAPSGTTFTGSGSVCNLYYVWDATENVEQNCVTVAVTHSGATVTITAPINVGRGDVVTVVADGVTNDSVITAQSLTVATSSDPTAQSSTYTLASKGKVKGATLQLSSYSESATNVSYRASFTSIDGLTSGHSTITLAASAGTLFDGSGSVCGVIVVLDDTNGTSNDCVTVTQSNSGATITVTVPIEVAPGDSVSVVADGVTNASTATDSLSLSTSSDTKVKALAYTLR